MVGKQRGWVRTREVCTVVTFPDVAMQRATMQDPNNISDIRALLSTLNI